MQLQSAGTAAGSSLASRAGVGLFWKSQPGGGTALPAEEAAGSGSGPQLHLAPGDALLQAQSPGSAQGVGGTLNLNEVLVPGRAGADNLRPPQ